MPSHAQTYQKKKLFANPISVTSLAKPLPQLFSLEQETAVVNSLWMTLGK